MLELIGRVRALKAAGRPLRLVGFEPERRPTTFSQHYRELGMASVLARVAATDPEALVMILTGNVHSTKEAINGRHPLLPAAAHLPPDETISLDETPTGGEAWTLLDSGSGARSLYGSDKSPRGVALYDKPRFGHDGTYSPGRPYTASPPVKALSSPPAVRP